MLPQAIMVFYTAPLTLRIKINYVSFMSETHSKEVVP